MRLCTGAVGLALTFGLASAVVVGQTRPATPRPTTARAAQSPARKAVPTSTPNRPWPAAVQKVGDGEAPVLSPAEALKTFHMAPGYRLELVASEPLVRNPVLMEFDGDSRLWVLELHGFAINEKMDNSFEPINSLVVLEDTDRNGVYDKRNVFLDKLIMPRAFKVLDKNCALVGEPPNLWKACDNNGDLRSDTKDLVDNKFSTLGVVEHGANGLYWGMDNILYVSEHGYNLRLDGNTFKTVPSLVRGQWGVTQDDGGRIYRNVNTDPLFVDYIPAHYFTRNPNMVRTSGLYEPLAKQEESMIWPVRPTLGLNRGYRKEVFRADSTATYYGGVSSPMIYRGTRLPKEIHGQPFVADSPTNLVHLLKLNNDAGRLSTNDFYKRGEFLGSTDERFRPVALTPGWDGTIYIADMYRGVSQDGPLQTDYLKNHIAKRGLWKGIDRGRIYRVVYDGMSFDGRPAMSKDTPAQLIAHLSHPNGWWRDTAQQLLVQRADASVVPALRQLAGASSDYRARLHALWTLDGLGALTPESVSKALADASPDVRASAVRLSERWLGDARSPIRAAVLTAVDDPNWLVRRQLAATLGELPGDARMAPTLAMLRKYGDDRMVVDAAVSGLSGREIDAMTQLLATAPGANTATMNTDALAMLAAAAGKRRDPAETQALLALTIDARQSEAVRLAVLKGVTAGLTGQAGGGGGDTVAGGRAGSAVPGMGGRRSGAASQLELPNEPKALAVLASGSGDVPAAARQVLALVGWPGKPAPPAVPPRTNEEEVLFAAGRDLYATHCSGCHQPEGRGGGTVAADLAGSKLVNGIGSIPVRILVHGKEGKIGLMPPLGADMSDLELASVLTYIRGAWGNTGAPLVAAAVREWRQAFAHRTTPWTDEELVKPTR